MKNVKFDENIEDADFFVNETITIHASLSNGDYQTSNSDAWQKQNYIKIIHTNDNQLLGLKKVKEEYQLFDLFKNSQQGAFKLNNTDVSIKIKPKYAAFVTQKNGKIQSVEVYRFSTKKLSQLKLIPNFFKADDLVFSDEHIGVTYKIFDINGKEQEVKSQFETRLVTSFTPVFYRAEIADHGLFIYDAFNILLINFNFIG